MKKLIVTAVALAFGVAAMAQQAPKKQEIKKEVKAVKQEVKTETTKVTEEKKQEVKQAGEVKKEAVEQKTKKVIKPIK